MYYWCKIFESRTEDERHPAYETIHGFLQKAQKQQFDEMRARKKESAPGPDGIPYGIYRCAGGLVSRYLLNAYKSVVEGGSVPTHSAASRTVFIPKSSTVDDHGLSHREIT